MFVYRSSSIFKYSQPIAALAASTIVYVAVSLLSGKEDFNLDKLLHRGEYSIDEDVTVVNAEPTKGWKVLGMGKEFTKGDKFIYVITYAWVLIWTAIFIFGTVSLLQRIVFQ